MLLLNALHFLFRLSRRRTTTAAAGALECSTKSLLQLAQKDVNKDRENVASLSADMEVKIWQYFFPQMAKDRAAAAALLQCNKAESGFFHIPNFVSAPLRSELTQWRKFRIVC